jgi:hypothetical protein
LLPRRPDEISENIQDEVTCSSYVWERRAQVVDDPVPDGNWNRDEDIGKDDNNLSDVSKFETLEAESSEYKV